MRLRHSSLALALALVAGCGGEGSDGETSTSPAATASSTPGDSTTTPAPPSSSPPAPPSPTTEPTATAKPPPPTVPDPVPRTLTPADDGRTYAMAVGQTSTLVLSDPDAPGPELVGRSVLLIQVVNVDASSRREWEVRAVETGTSTIRGGGSDPWEIRLEVN